jgi:glutamate dehydrogenase (NAD(P)+)
MPILGDPIATLTLREPATGVRAILVLDTLHEVSGAGGGVRMMPGVTVDEMRRLARAMTYKYAIGGAPSGGAKLGIVADPADPRKPEILRGVARLIAPFARPGVYRFGEDMGITKDDVALMYRAIDVDPIALLKERARRFGKDLQLARDATWATAGGRNFEDVVTGYGLMEVLLEACEMRELDPLTLRVAIQGFGTVGAGLAALLDARGIRVVAIADAAGVLERETGLPIPALLSAKSPLGAIDRSRLPGGIRRRPRDEWLDTPAEVVVPAAIADAITVDNAGAVKAQIVLEAANLPVTREAEAALHARGVTVIPDFVANAGAAIGYAMLWHGPSPVDRIIEDVGRRLRAVTREVLDTARRSHVLPRQAAEAVALATLELHGIAHNRADGR